MAVPAEHREILSLTLDLLIPEDATPSAVGAGVLDWMDRLAEEEHAEQWAALLSPGFTALALEPDAPSASLIAELERQDARTGWTVSPSAFVSGLVRLAALGYYGLPDAPSWESIGFDPKGKRAPGAPITHVSLRQEGLRYTDAGVRWDAIIVGAGAGGGVAARVLAEAGARVLLIDRGRFLEYDEMSRDHLANQRFGPFGRNNAGPAEREARVLEAPDGQARILDRPADRAWQGNAMTVGGGTRVYQGMAWRFQPGDFEMASRFGVPEGSSLSDWPISYDDLEPFYTRAEREFGVAGNGSAHVQQGHRSAEYPLPPATPNLEASILKAGADVLGLTTGPVPMLINTIPHAGRAACVECGECVGFACRSDAKNGSHNTVIPLALATGRCTLVTGVRVERVLVDTAGRATGVVATDTASGLHLELHAGTVILSAGAIETARLLLASATDEHPAGLGNRTDQVGRHLQGHVYTGAFGLFDEIVNDVRGPGVSIATADYTNDLGGEGIGGGVIANECVKLPAHFWDWAQSPTAPRWGHEGKEAMRNGYLRTSHLFGPIQEISRPDARVRLDPFVRDGRGDRVVRLSGDIHPESLRSATALRRRAVEWMRASGARDVWGMPLSGGLSAGQHQAGTARMGTDPATSVTDPFGRVHGHPGLWVMDASLHVTNGGVNPVLTVIAVAYRCAEEFVRAS
jgi:choline dehydrogenase-like flavoprotein